MMQLLLKELPSDDPYGLGKVRTIEEFQEFIGLDFRSRTSLRHSKLGVKNNATPEEWYFKYGIQNESA
jgi:hypothetical protein